MAKLQSEFSKDGLVVVGVNGFNDSREKVQKFVKAFDADYLVLLNGAEVSRNDYFVTGYPTTFWIDPQGQIVKRMTGFDKTEFDAMRAELKSLLRTEIPDSPDR